MRKGALTGKKDIQSAFQLLPCYLGDFDLLGFKIGSIITLINAFQWGAQFPAKPLNNFQHLFIG